MFLNQVNSIKEEIIGFIKESHSCQSKDYNDSDFFNDLIKRYQLEGKEEAVLKDWMWQLMLAEHYDFEKTLEIINIKGTKIEYELHNEYMDSYLEKCAKKYLSTVRNMIRVFNGDFSKTKYFNPIAYKVATDEKYTEVAELVFSHFMDIYKKDYKISKICWTCISDEFLSNAIKDPSYSYSFEELVMEKIVDWFRSVDSLSSLKIRRPDLEKYFSELKEYDYLSALLEEIEFWDLDEITGYVIDTYC